MALPSLGMVGVSLESISSSSESSESISSLACNDGGLTLKQGFIFFEVFLVSHKHAHTPCLSLILLLNCWARGIQQRGGRRVTGGIRNCHELRGRLDGCSRFAGNDCEVRVHESSASSSGRRGRGWSLRWLR